MRISKRLRIPRRRPRWLVLVMVLTLPAIGLLRYCLCTTRITGQVDSVPSATHLEIAGERIRLDQVVLSNQPEQRQQARRLLRQLVSGQTLRCRGCRREQGAPVNGWCELEDGARLGKRLVEAGLARDCPAASGGIHARFETASAAAIPLPDRCRPWIRRGPRPSIR